MRVNVLSHDSIWASQFAAIKRDLEQILGPAGVLYKSIEHVGSTSVPGLAAKPNIDIDVVVSGNQVQPTISALEQSGQYENLGELGIPQRWACRFLLPTNETMPLRNTYVTIDGCQSLRNHLAVRDVCRINTELRDEYSQAKLKLSQLEWVDVNEYCEAKNDIVSRILAAGGMGSEIEAIRSINHINAKP